MRKNFYIFACLVFLVALLGGVTGKKKQIPREITQVLEINATTIQTHADHLFSLLSALVEEPRNREEIVNYLTQFRDLAYSINSYHIKTEALSLADYFFDVVENLRSRTRDTLLAVSEINTKNLNQSFVSEAQDKFSDLQTFVEKELERLKDRVSCALAKLFFEQFRSLSREGKLNEIQRLLDLYNLASDRVFDFYRSVIRKAQDTTGIVNLAQNLASANASQSLENEIRSLSRELAANLEGFQVGFFRTLTRDYINIIYSNFYDLRGDLYDLASRALQADENQLRYEAYFENRTANGSLPRGAASILNERLESVRQSFGERVVAFREATIAELVRVVRGAVNAAGIRNIPELNDPNFFSAVSSTISQIRGKIERLVSSLREAYQIESEEFLRRYWASRGRY